MLAAGAELIAASLVLSITLGLWLAWILVNRQFAGRRELGVILTAALALPVPMIASGIVFGADARGWAVAVGTLLSAGPVMVFGARLAFRSIDRVYTNTARSLGASDWRVFWRVELPLVWRLVLATGGFAVARLLAEVALMFLAGAWMPRPGR